MNHSRAPTPAGRLRTALALRKPTTTASKIVRLILEEIERQERTYKEVFEKAGITKSRSAQWKDGTSTPRLLTVEDIAQVLEREFVLIDPLRKDAETLSRLVHDLIPPMTETGDLSQQHKANAFDAVRRALYGPGPKEVSQ